jgi:hypothetical protein
MAMILIHGDRSYADAAARAAKRLIEKSPTSRARLPLRAHSSADARKASRTE